MRKFLGSLLACLLFTSLAAAEEGMWLFNTFPSAKVKSQYGFEPTQAWLDHVRLSSVRFNNGGSGSFVSADGLTFTNHHVGADCIHELSTAGKDYMKTGFYARTRAEEAKCPNLELNVLVGIEDVTEKVQAAAKPGMPTAEAGKAQRAEMAAIEKDCAGKTGLRCDVVTLYSGGMYHLYRYKKYTDVRLVFAPEFEIAFFGGDPDNFEYPRYDLDITFFRVYEDDKPANLENYLKWSQGGVKAGDAIFVSGHPGSTGRLLTVAQMEFLRDVSYPWILKTYKARAEMLQQFSAQSEENARVAQEALFGVQNSIKALSGYNSGLTDQQTMAKKAADEKELRAFVAKDEKLKAEAGNAWDEIAQAAKVRRETYLPFQYVEEKAGFRGDLARHARHLVRLAEEKQKPNADRLREYRESALPSLEQELFSTAPVYKSLETALLTFSLEEMQRDLGAENETVKKVLGGKSPAEVAKQIIAGTKLDEVAVRKQLYEGGENAIAESQDPLIGLMKAIDPDARALRKRYDDEVDSVYKTAGGQIARARFAMAGTGLYPDATFTLRLSYGSVKGFVEDGRGSIAPKGTKVPYFTTIGGAYEHARKHGSKPPYKLPESWMKAASKVNKKTPFNTVSTTDIIGGNSGSPVVNQKAEVVGIIFDGNIQSLPWNFVYSDQVGRAVEVDSRGIVEALRAIYGADALVQELTGTGHAGHAGHKQ